MNSKKDMQYADNASAPQNPGAHPHATLEDHRLQIALSLSATVLLLLHLFVPSLKIDTIGLSLIVLAMLPWLIPFLQRFVKSGKFLGTEFEFLQEKVETQEKQIQDQQGIIDDQQEIINKLVIYSLGEPIYVILWDLQNSASLLYRNDDNFRRWMYVLLDNGYIQPKEPLTWLEFNEKAEGKNLVEMARPTPAAQFLFKLRGDPHKRIA